MYEWIGKMTENHYRLQWIRWLLPKSVVLLVCNLVSGLLFLSAYGLRMRIMRNMRDILPDMTFRDTYLCCRAYFFNLCITLYEILIDSPGNEGKYRTRFTVEGEAYLEAALSQGRGAILFAPHMGNFFYYYWHLSQKYRCITVATAGSQELRPIYLRFQQMGCAGLDYDATPPLTLMRELREHLQQNGIVLLLGDFYRPHFPPSTWFGRPTRTPGGAAVLALEHQVPVLPFFGYRTDGFNHRLVFDKPVYLHEEFDRRQRTEATGRLNRTMEKAVVQVPEQWFYWFNAEERWESKEDRREEQPGNDSVA